MYGECQGTGITRTKPRLDNPKFTRWTNLGAAVVAAAVAIFIGWALLANWQENSKCNHEVKSQKVDNDCPTRICGKWSPNQLGYLMVNIQNVVSTQGKHEASGTKLFSQSIPEALNTEAGPSNRRKIVGIFMIPKFCERTTRIFSYMNTMFAWRDIHLLTTTQSSKLLKLQVHPVISKLQNLDNEKHLSHRSHTHQPRSHHYP